MFDTEKFIMAVQCRPCLYDMKIKEYSNRDIKGKAWIEIAEELNEGWKEMDKNQQSEEGKFILLIYYEYN